MKNPDAMIIAITIRNVIIGISSLTITTITAITTMRAIAAIII
jgi:hypothetical protein